MKRAFVKFITHAHIASAYHSATEYQTMLAHGWAGFWRPVPQHQSGLVEEPSPVCLIDDFIDDIKVHFQPHFIGVWTLF